MLNKSLVGIEDYIAGVYPATFIAGTTRALISITINDDNIFENNENFTLTINPSSLPSNVNVGDPSEAAVTIIDDDRKIMAICNICL